MEIIFLRYFIHKNKHHWSLDSTSHVSYVVLVSLQFQISHNHCNFSPLAFDSFPYHYKVANGCRFPCCVITYGKDEFSCFIATEYIWKKLLWGTDLPWIRHLNANYCSLCFLTFFAFEHFSLSDKSANNAYIALFKKKYCIYLVNEWVEQ